MRNAIMATLDHYCSTDELPCHDNCPEGAESWCECRKAEATNTLAAFKHPPRLIDEHVEKHIRPMYEELSKDQLLTRCLGGHTQNANESFNSTVWRMTPKHLHSGIKIVEIAAYIAGGMFNEGYSAALKTMQLLDLKIRQQCNNFAERADKERVTRENRRASFSSKEARTARRLEHLGENQFFEESEGQLYGPGIADEHINAVSSRTLRFFIYENFDARFLDFSFLRFFLIGGKDREKTKRPIGTRQNGLYSGLNSLLVKPKKLQER